MLPAEAAHASRDSGRQQILAAQVRLLYRNAGVSVAVTLVGSAILGRLQWKTVPHVAIFGWWLYMSLLSAGRFVLARLYWRAAPANVNASRWRDAFTVGAGFAGAGWGAAGIVLYPKAHLANQMFLIFILGGMMLGAASLLAPRPEAFVAFLVPAGLAPSARLMMQGDEAHLFMGLLAGIFTLATLITTWRIHLTIVSSLTLQFENRDLVEDLQAAKSHAEALNEQLEVRVQERTAELRAEIAQREQVEEELLRARKLESVGVLAGGIAHDFNNFLTVVQVNIEIAKMQLAPDEPVQAVLDQTASSCRQAAFLSDQLLTFAKGGAPVRRLVSIGKLVTDAVQLARAGAQTRIEVSIAGDLRCAKVDPGQMGQVLHNVLLNARQAMQDGGVTEVRAENAGESRVRISIRDHGCGIPADILPRIFDPYFTTKPGGTGLGLATAYAIIAKHDGGLSVDSKPGEGTMFTIDLPASQETPAPEVRAAAQMATGTARLLIMDDDETLRRVLRGVLTELGYEVETAGDGAEAIALCDNAKAAGRRFEAVLLDLTVRGGMGGIEAAEKLRGLDPSLKLIVSSGYADAPVMSDFRNYGFDDVVRKPWSVAQVSEVFRRVLMPARKRSAG